MSQMTTEQVNGAIEWLETSFSYDPPKRWLDAYRELRELTREMEAQLRPYRWIALLCSALGLAWFVCMVGLSLWRPGLFFSISSNVLLAGVIYATAWSLAGWLIAGGHSLVIHLAARRHPLLRLKSKVDAALRRVAAFPSGRSPTS